VSGLATTSLGRCQFCVVEMERFKLADGTLRWFASRAT
jgi:hypothetical protein